MMETNKPRDLGSILKEYGRYDREGRLRVNCQIHGLQVIKGGGWKARAGQVVAECPECKAARVPHPSTLTVIVVEPTTEST